MILGFIFPMSPTLVHANTNPAGGAFGGFLNYQNLVLTPGSNESQRRFTWYTDQPVGWIAYRVHGSQTYQMVQSHTATTDARRGMYIHRASIYGLIPSTIYEYMLIGSDGLQSPVHTFRTSDPSDFSFFIVGDIQIGAGNVPDDSIAWLRTLNMATANFPNAGMILSAGDQVHQGGSVSAFDALFRPHQLSRLSFAPTVGNHDSGVRFFPNHFNLPNVTPFGTGATQMNYWFRYGSALFIVLDSNTTDIEAHRSFLHTAVNSNLDATWRVVMFHHGPYTEFRAQHYAPKVAIRNNWIPLIDSLGIDIVLNGHCHAFNRTFHMIGNEPRPNQIWLDGGNFRHDPTGLLYNTVLDPMGTVYFTFNSSTGNRFYSLAGRQPRFFTASRNQSYLPNFSVANVTDNSFSIITFQLNPDNTITEIDSYTIYKTVSTLY